MEGRGLRVNLWDLLSPLARAHDMMSPALAEHSLRVAYLALRVGEELGWPAEERRDLGVAGALHDIGAFSLNETVDLLEFEETRPLQHAAAGALLLRPFKPFSRAAALVEFHHLPWRNGEGAFHGAKPVPAGSHVLHLADRVAVLIRKEREILGQLPEISASISLRRGSVFVPEHAEAMMRLASREYIWLDIGSAGMEAVLRRELGMHMAELDDDSVREFSRMICRLIDFKSPFTATHSSGVAAAAESLARRVGFSPRERRMFENAGYLHDMGKLAIPAEILEKPAALSPAEWNVMRSHVYHTDQILSPIEALRTIASWGALHQERLNGSGYPFHYTIDDIPLGARILAVADVFTALTEDRPYRKGLAREAVLAEMREMVRRQELDGNLAELLERHYEEVDRARAAAQARSQAEYEEFRAAVR